MYKYELMVYTPKNVLDLSSLIEGEIILDTRVNASSVLSFTVLNINQIKKMYDESISFFEGNTVKFSVNGKLMFVGRIMEKSRDDNPFINVLAYDILNYLVVNKDTYTIYNNLSTLVRLICDDFNLPVGKIAKTSFLPMEPIIKDNCTLISIIGVLLDYELINNKKAYVLKPYDNMINLIDIEELIVPFIAEKGTNILSYEYTTTINQEVYSKIKLYQDDKNSGMRISYEENAVEEQGKWGVIQYYEKMDEAMSSDEIRKKAKKLLENYRGLSRTLEMSVLGEENLRVESGSTIYVNIPSIGELSINQAFVVEACQYTFKEDYYDMKLKLRGEIVHNGGRDKRDY